MAFHNSIFIVFLFDEVSKGMPVTLEKEKRNYIFEISRFHWSICTVECAICLTLIWKFGSGQVWWKVQEIHEFLTSKLANQPKTKNIHSLIVTLIKCFAIYVFLTKKCKITLCNSLLWVNEIIVYQLPMVDLSTMGKLNHKVSFTNM